MRFAYAFALSLGMLTSVGAQDIETCALPDADFDDAAVLVETLEILEDIEIERTEVTVDIEHNYINDITLELVSPEGTTLTLFDRSGGSADDIQLTFSDDGVPFGDEDFDCQCDMQIEVDSLGLLGEEMTAGDWTLEVTDNFPGDDGTLNEWCLTFWAPCTVVAPTDLTCTTTDEDVEITWIDGEAYDRVEIFRDGALVATLTEGETSYTDLGLDMGIYEYLLVGYVDADDCGNPSDTCRTTVSLLELCSSEEIILEDFADTVATLTVAEDTYLDGEPVEVELRIDLDHADLGELAIDIEHGGTTVALHDLDLSGETRLAVVYSDFGTVLTSDDAACECLVLPGAGAQLTSLLDETAEGDWTLTISDTLEDGLGTLNEWCVVLYDEPTDPDPTFIRGDADGNGTFSGLLDGLFVLQYQFIIGAPEPPCMEAADADDSGGITGLLDGLYILQAQFLLGAPQPPAPYPFCDVLAEDDLTDLGCEVPPDC